MPRLEISGAIHKLRRLISMSPYEIVHRLREKSFSELERIGVGTAVPGLPGHIGFRSYLAGAPASRFYAGCDDGTRGFVRTNFPQWIQKAAAEADQLCLHEVELLDIGRVYLGEQIDWHRDPVTGMIWEKLFWSDYRLENDPAGRDPKRIHELNRHQHLPRLAKAFYLTGNERYSAEALSQLESWIKQNPPGTGINWQSSLEVGIRMLSWLWTLFLLLPSRLLHEALAHDIGTSLFAHVEHIYRHTSIHSSPNTHLIGEATALFIAGLVFQDYRRAAAWRERGAELLIQESDRQILGDGAYGELSSYYHCYALDFYLQALILARRNRYPIPDQVWKKIHAMLHFLMHVTRPDGTLPHLGDDDGGRALAIDNKTYRSFPEAMCLGAVLFHRGDFKHQSEVFREEALWMLGANAWDLFNGLESRPPRETHACFADSGYSIHRSGWGPHDSHLIFDFGGLGMHTGGHAHADCLSLTLFSKGREVLIDPGTFAYNGAPQWRDYFRSTRAHNTVTIDGRDQAEVAGTFRWKSKLPSRLLHHSAASVEYLEAEHFGYRRNPPGVIHRRRLLHIPAEYWIVADDFRGTGLHTFDFSFHFGAGVHVSTLHHQQEDLVTWAEQAGFLMSFHTSQPMTTDLISGRTLPIEGWVSSGYGAKTACLTLRATVTSAIPPAAVTFLVPADQPPIVRRLEVDLGEAIACVLEHGELHDYVVFPGPGSAVSLGNFVLRGEFFWFRLNGTVLEQAMAVCATEFRYNGRSVLEDALCAQFAA